jgi:hypothetical protein
MEADAAEREQVVQRLQSDLASLQASLQEAQGATATSAARVAQLEEQLAGAQSAGSGEVEALRAALEASVMRSPVFLLRRMFSAVPTSFVAPGVQEERVRARTVDVETANEKVQRLIAR